MQDNKIMEKSSLKKDVIVRFAPSPTGNLHIGGARTALFNYLFAKHLKGKFLLRIEDTDVARSKDEYTNNILDGLKWLGLLWDNDEILKQSNRTDIYKKYIEDLISNGKAYISKEEIKNEGDRAEVIRFKNPNEKIRFNDLIRGDIEFDTTELGDFIIAKSLSEPIFHLTNVVDDIEMGVTHIIRGEDHISNTPRQIAIWRAIGAPEAIYAHIPLILAPDRSKLSKRHGAVSLIEYKDRGYLPEAIVNYLSLLGWNPGTEKEIMSLSEIVELFDISKVQKGGAIFNEEKLKWINKEHIKLTPADKIESIIESFVSKSYSESNLASINKSAFYEMIKERVTVFGEIKESIEKGEFDFYFKMPIFEDMNAIVWKKDSIENAKENLKACLGILNNLSESDFKKEILKEKIWPLAEEKGKGNVLWPLRYSLSGKKESPDPFVLMSILGKKEVINRIKNVCG